MRDRRLHAAALSFVLGALALACATQPVIAPDDEALFAAGLDHYLRTGQPGVTLIRHSLDPSHVHGAPSISLAKNDPMFAALLSVNQRSVSLKFWDTPRRRSGFPAGFLGFSLPAYNARRDEALLWIVHVDVVPREVGGPAVVLEDVVLRFAKKDGQWRIERVYAFSPD